MRTLFVMFLASVLGVLSAWGATRWEFRRPEEPLSGLGPGGSAGNQPLPGQPRLLVESSETFDFGTMDVHTTQSHLFVLKNVGDAPLQLTKGKSSCGCTQSEFDDAPIAPGETREVKLEWRPFAANDSFRQAVEVHTNDPRRETIELIIKGVVQETLKLDPPSLNIGQVAVSQDHAFEVKCYSTRDVAPNLKGWECRDESLAPYFEITGEKLSAEQIATHPYAKSGLLLQVRLKSGLPLGSLNEKIAIKHDYEKIAPLQLTLAGRGVGDITVLGPDYVLDRDYLEMGNVNRAFGKQSRLFLVVKGEHRAATKFSVESMEPAESLKVTLGEPRSTPESSSSIWPILVEVPVNAPAGNHLGTETNRLARVTLKTTHPLLPELVLRVRVAISD